MFPLAVWQPGTLQPSTPVNDNALRVEVLQRGALSILSTPPGSPADGDVHILGASPTAAWSAFAQNDVVLWRSGTWYRFAPFTGWLKQVGSDVRRFNGSAWVVISGSGGGAVPVQEEGTTVVASPTAINFVGAGVTATNSGGVATVTIPGGGGATAWKWRGSVRANVGSTLISAIGAGSPNFVAGGASGPVPSLTNYFTALPRRMATATSSTTAVNGYRSGDGVPFYRGASAGIGGFEISQTMGVGAGGATASHRFFMGVRNDWVNATDVNPSTYINMIGIGYDSGDTQVQVMHNDATGAATKVALGASFPKPSADEVWVYRLVLTAVAGSSSVAYSVTALNTGATASGTISTDLPAATLGLSYWGQLSAGGTATAIGLAFIDVDMAAG